ncbi:MAG: rhomboid family intramembrane serine protease [Bacteroidales bacterium]|nr:rhomboid family intramembrane serine protease [Bacteroidales bacterium]
MAFVDQIKNTFKRGSTLARLIYINVAVFIILKIVYLFFFFIYGASVPMIQLKGMYFDKVIGLFAIPADFSAIIKQPWSLITYMFLHEGFLHILFNMLWLYWFGRIFLMYLDAKKLLNTYILGGICGAILYVLAFNIFPVFQTVLQNSVALGASASVMAIVIAISIYKPDFTIHLLLLGPVKLKYIAIVSIIIDLLSIPHGNAGGHIAHLGGAFYGYLFVVQLKRGKDISRGFGNFMDGLFSAFKPRKKIKVTYRKPVDDFEYNAQKVAKQEEIDRILDKIAKSGYESLSKQEKEILFRASKK